MRRVKILKLTLDIQPLAVCLALLTLCLATLPAYAQSTATISIFTTPSGSAAAQSSVQLSAAVTGTGGSPTGTIQFFTSYYNTCSSSFSNIGSPVTLTANSGNIYTASLSTSTLPVGSYTICGAYTPTANNGYTATTSNPGKALTVTPLALTSFSITNTSGSPNTTTNPLSVSVNLAGNNVAGPSGAVQIFTSSSSSCSSASIYLGEPNLTVTVVSGGIYIATASLTSPSAPVGSYYVCATYLPDASSDFSSATIPDGASATVNAQALQPDATTATATPTSFVYGQAGSFHSSTTVTPTSGAMGIPAGSVNFSLTGTGATTAQLTLGSATLSTATSGESLVSGVANQISLLPTRAMAVDLRGNGLLDVVALPTSAPFSSQIPNYLQVFLNSGSDSFQAEQDVPTGCGTVEDFAVGDLTGNGIPDLVALCSPSSASTTVATLMRGNGNGTFQSPQVIITSTNTTLTSINNIAMGDFNGDGVMDLALIDASSGQIQVYTGSNSSGTFTPLVASSFPAGTAGVGAPAVADFNQDGKSDIAVIQQPNANGTAAIELLTSNGDGTFSAQSQTFSTYTTSYFHAPAITDVNGDGYPDILVANPSGQILVYKNNGKGTLNAPLTYTAPSPQTAAGAPFPITGKPPASAITQPANIYYLSYGANESLSLAGVHLSGTTFTNVYPAQNAGYDIGTYEGADIVLAGDFNADGYNDATVLSDPTTLGPPAILRPYFYTNSSTASLTSITQQPNAGTYDLTASYPGSSTFASSGSANIPITIQAATPATSLTPSSTIIASGQSITFTATVTGVTGGTIPTGNVSFTLVNASNNTNTTSTVALTSVAGSTYAIANFTATNLPVSTNPYTLVATYSGSGNYTSADFVSASLTVQSGAVLTSISPSTDNLGDPATTITLTGGGFLATSVAQWNGTPLTTAYVSPTSLTAVIPASDLTTVQTASVTVATPNESVTAAQSFKVVAPAAQATFTGPSTAAPGSQPTLNFQFSQSYPVAVTATFTLTVESAASNGLTDPAVQFANGGTTYTVTIPANSTAPVPVQIQTGTLAALITVTAQLNAGGVDITSSTLAPVILQVPSSPPVITSVSLVRSGTTLTVTVQGFSSTRDMQSANFDFTGASGSSIANPNVTVPLTSAFTNWYSQTISNQYGSAFSYAQTFQLSQNASTVGSVSVTLTNSVGASNTESAQ